MRQFVSCSAKSNMRNTYEHVYKVSIEKDVERDIEAEREKETAITADQRERER